MLQQKQLLHCIIIIITTTIIMIAFDTLAQYNFLLSCLDTYCDRKVILGWKFQNLITCKLLCL